MYALVENGIVINVVMWDGNTEAWQPPQGVDTVEVTEQTGPAYIGFPYAGGRFEAPPSPVNP